MGQPGYPGVVSRVINAKKLIMGVMGEIGANEKLTRVGCKVELHDINRKLAKAVLQLEPIIGEYEEDRAALMERARRRENKEQEQ
tara:strand:+ start:272 stop:526 length:255 start_codon:yes stop_codon:yes gene_type:complete